MNSRSDSVLLVFLKYPEPGRVKTRLAQSIGEKEATRLYRSMAEQVIRETESSDYDQYLLIDPPEEKAAFERWLGKQRKCLPQSSGDLGKKLAGAFCAAFEAGALHVIAIGTDCPYVSHKDIGRAFFWLREKEAVLGPASDGGYYLIGLQRDAFEILDGNLHRLFEDISWSTEEVHRQTVQRMENFGLDYLDLPEKRDIDTLEDLLMMTTGYAQWHSEC